MIAIWMDENGREITLKRNAEGFVLNSPSHCASFGKNGLTNALRIAVRYAIMYNRGSSNFALVYRCD